MTLARATVTAIVVAVLLWLGVVTPAETGRDPLGTGRVLGLTRMGQIKMALAREAEADIRAAMTTETTETTSTEEIASLPSTSNAWRDSMIVRLQPMQGVEVKMTMREQARAVYEWSVDSGEVYFHRHGEPPNAPKDVAAHSYAKGTAPSDRGEIVAVFDGVHGWFWRNRSDKPLQITLRTRGHYLSLKELP